MWTVNPALTILILGYYCTCSSMYIRSYVASVKPPSEERGEIKRHALVATDHGFCQSYYIIAIN